jgi:dihydrofolate synthase/folylpolyglutamate synthase
MSDKRLEQMADILFPAADELILTSIQSPRSATIEMLEPIARRFIDRKKITATLFSSEAVRIAREKTLPDGLVCIAGSLYLIGETRPFVSF